MRRIDCHVHIFEVLKGFNGKGEMRPIGGGLARWADGEVVRMLPPELGDKTFAVDTCYQLLKRNGVEKAVLLQGSFYGFHNEYVAEAVKKYPDMFIGAGTFDPFGKYADRIYDRLTNELGMKAMKFETSTGCGFMSYHRDFDIAEVFGKVAKKAAENGQTLVLDVGSPGMSSFQPEAIRKLAQENPELRIVVCHLLAPTLRDEEALKKSLEMLRFDNVYFDISAVPFNVQPETYPYPTGIRYIREACGIVGYDKLLWGTDIPSVLCYDSYQHLADYFTGEFTEEELQAIFYGNARKAYSF